MNALRCWLSKHGALHRGVWLAVGMVAIMLVAMQGQELTAAQSACMIFGGVLLAGVCAWILSWE